MKTFSQMQWITKRSKGAVWTFAFLCLSTSLAAEAEIHLSGTFPIYYERSTIIRDHKVLTARTTYSEAELGLVEAAYSYLSNSHSISFNDEIVSDGITVTFGEKQEPRTPHDYDPYNGEQILAQVQVSAKVGMLLNRSAKAQSGTQVMSCQFLMRCFVRVSRSSEIEYVCPSSFYSTISIDSLRALNRASRGKNFVITPGGVTQRCTDAE